MLPVVFLSFLTGKLKFYLRSALAHCLFIKSQVGTFLYALIGDWLGILTRPVLFLSFVLHGGATANQPVWIQTLAAGGWFVGFVCSALLLVTGFLLGQCLNAKRCTPAIETVGTWLLRCCGVLSGLDGLIQTMAILSIDDSDSTDTLSYPVSLTGISVSVGQAFFFTASISDNMDSPLVADYWKIIAPTLPMLWMNNTIYRNTMWGSFLKWLAVGKLGYWVLAKIVPWQWLEPIGRWLYRLFESVVQQLTWLVQVAWHAVTWLAEKAKWFMDAMLEHALTVHVLRPLLKRTTPFFQPAASCFLALLCFRRLWAAPLEWTTNTLLVGGANILVGCGALFSTVVLFFHALDRQVCRSRMHWHIVCRGFFPTVIESDCVFLKLSLSLCQSTSNSSRAPFF